MAKNPRPVPDKAPMTDKAGLPTLVWSEWFRNLMGESLKAADGYTTLPSGIIIQWGDTGSLNSATTTAVDFPMDFPNGCFAVVVGIKGNSASSTTATGHCGSGNYGTTGFDLYNRTSIALSFTWVAIGY